jgi:hypothetical protein
VEEAITYLDDGDRPRARERKLLRRLRVKPLGWTLLAASVVGSVAAAASSEVVRRVLDTWASSLNHLARSARALLPL